MKEQDLPSYSSFPFLCGLYSDISCSFCGAHYNVYYVFCKFPEHKYSMRRPLCSNCIENPIITKW